MKGDFYFQYYKDRAKFDKLGMTQTEECFYHRLVDAQFETGRMTIKMIRKIVGNKNFGRYWAALGAVMEEQNGLFYIPWVDESLKKREQASENAKKAVAVKNRKALLKEAQNNWK